MKGNTTPLAEGVARCACSSIPAAWLTAGVDAAPARDRRRRQGTYDADKEGGWLTRSRGSDKQSGGNEFAEIVEQELRSWIIPAAVRQHD